MRRPKWLYPAIAGGTVVAVVAIGGSALASSGASPAAQTTLYGCDVGANRTLEYVFTVEANYITFLDAHGGKCPSGFEVTVGASGTTTTPPAPVQEAPAVTDSAASSLTSSGATLNGTVNPEGATTTYQFQYGTSTAYGTEIPATAADAGSGTSAVSETSALTGLAASTAYDYRLVATNSAGTTDGPNKTFTTAASSGGGGGTGTWSCTVNEAMPNGDDGSGCPSTGDYSSTQISAGSNASVYDSQDEWNQGDALKSQEMQANSGSDWQVTANAAAGNGAVLSYPDVQATTTNVNDEPVPLTDYTGLTSTYSTVMPSDANSGVTAGKSDDYEAAYDLWLGNSTEQSWSGTPCLTAAQGGACDLEIMVWTDNHNQTPAGHDTGKTYTAPNGDTYEIWTDGTQEGGGATSVSDYDIVTFVKTSNSQTGSLDMLSMFQWMESNGYINASENPGVDQLDYGFEICSTSGANETFAVNGYTLNATGSGV